MSNVGVEQPNDQSLFQKLNVNKSCQKTLKLDILFLKSCPILLYLFTLCQIFCLILNMLSNCNYSFCLEKRQDFIQFQDVLNKCRAI